MIPSVYTIEKLRKLQQFILEEPRRFNLSFWGAHIGPEDIKEDCFDLADQLDDLGVIHVEEIQNQYPPCGTVACLAGNVCVMEGVVKPDRILPGKLEIYSFDEDTPRIARLALGISENDAERLFYLRSFGFRDLGWPEEFERRVLNCTPGTKKYAQVAVDRIEHYIKTGE